MKQYDVTVETVLDAMKETFDQYEKDHKKLINNVDSGTIWNNNRDTDYDTDWDIYSPLFLNA